MKDMVCTNSPSIHVITVPVTGVDLQRCEISKPPDYETVVGSCPPSYDEAIQATPSAFLQPVVPSALPSAPRAEDVESAPDSPPDPAPSFWRRLFRRGSQNEWKTAKSERNRINGREFFFGIAQKLKQIEPNYVNTTLKFIRKSINHQKKKSIYFGIFLLMGPTFVAVDRRFIVTSIKTSSRIQTKNFFSWNQQNDKKQFACYLSPCVWRPLLYWTLYSWESEYKVKECNCPLDD